MAGDHYSIIELMTVTGVIHQECERQCHNETLCLDLEQEITMILLGSKPELIIELNAKSELLYYIKKIIKNQWYSGTSPFYKTYKKQKALLYGAKKETENDPETFCN